MQPKLSKYDEICDTSRHLVHLGKDDFCVVQTCSLFRITAYQHIQVFYITKLSDYSMIMTGELHHDVEIEHYGSLDVILGFSLPKGMTAELKEGKRFDLDPHPEFYAVSKPVQDEEIVNPVQEEEILTPVQEEEIVTLHKDGLHATSELDNDSSQTNFIDEQGLPSLFALVDYGSMNPPYYSILQLDPKDAAHLTVDEKVCFNRPRELSWIGWLFSPPTSSTGDLYMVPSMVITELQALKPLHCSKFNFSTGSFVPIKPFLPSKSCGHVLNLGGDIYFISHDYYDTRPVFQPYDPAKNSWNALEFCQNFPVLFECCIVATAVWGDTILFNVECRVILAYDLSGNKWYEVDVEDERCYGIVGEAVVLEDTIYAFSRLVF